ncbi:preprotein translocase subunit SecD [Methanohalophilus sp.]|uniref:preprotein translocase subunit SecD n=1 Tax=Methanohalophilus sp. TaxID=1966352 RepID=UPI0026291FA3|nr:preprotein translocase subunit SecD [Methanohalophilus sp.]MDK2891941.1 preprotein translocase subunit SecD [Methanohalophilus sp.]
MNEGGKQNPKTIWQDWRVRIFIFALLLSVVAIHPWYSADKGFDTNLNYGLDLEGGSWLQVKLQGAVIQADANLGQMAEALLESTTGYDVTIQSVTKTPAGTSTIVMVTDEPVVNSQMDLLGLGEYSIASEGNGSVVTLFTTEQVLMVSYLSNSLGCEVVPFTTEDGVEYEIRTAVSEEELNTLLAAVGGSILSDESGELLYRDGVRTETRDLTKDILSDKLNGLGLKDIPVRTVGDEYILIDFAGIDLTTAKDIALTPGKFEIRIQTNGNQTKHVLYGDDIASVGIAGYHDGQWFTPFTLSEEGALALQKVAIETGATQNPDAHWLMMYLDGEEVYGAPLSLSAASKLQQTPIYAWEASTGSDEDSENRAKQLQIHLRSGALPVNVELMGSGQVDAALGSQFKMEAVIAGLLALIAVALTVYRRYRKKQILIPMVGTSLSEVIMILGFASAINWQLDLPAIAGIIAAIGTGIDHLVIITDEVLYEGKLPSTKIYLSRISRAFGIIFAAAATTVIAMAPLVVMGFGALKGFAITTIIGVMIGVLIARPVYGKVIKHVLYEEEG